MRRNLVIISFIITPLAAFAEPAHGTHHEAGIDSLIPYWINFGILFLALFFLLKNKVITSWNQRRLNIAQNVSSATQQLRESKSVLDFSTQKLSKIDEECNLAKQSIAKQTQTEMMTRMNAAKEKAERIVKQAEETARSDFRRAEETLKRELVEKALANAKENLANDSKLKFGPAITKVIAEQSGQLIN